MKTNSNKLPLIIALVGGGLLAWKLFGSSARSETDTSNRNTNDITDRETQQAMELYDLMGVYKDPLGAYHTALFGWGVDAWRIYNVCLAITNWSKVQSKFSGLCDNKFSLSKALSGALRDGEYSTAIKYAAAKKVVTTKESQAVISNKTKNFPANTVLGSFVSEGKTPVLTKTYTFVNGYTSDTNKAEGWVLQANAKLV